MARRRKSTAPGSPSEGASAPSLDQIQITKKKVTGDEGVTYVLDQRLQVGDEITQDTAQLLIDNGVAIDISGGKLQAQILEEKGAAKVKNDALLQKGRADAEMARFDALDPDEREDERNRNPEEGEDIG